MKTKLFYLTIATLGTFSLAYANTYSVSGNAEFIATGKPGFIKIDGKGSGLQGTLTVTGDSVSGQASFPLSTLNTGVDYRDKHLKEEYLHVEKYPEAKLIVDSVKLSGNPEVNGFKQDKAPFTGKMTVHGVTHDVSGTIDVSTADGVSKGDADFGIKISDFGFSEPKFMGMKVNDDVQIKVSLVAKKAK